MSSWGIWRRERPISDDYGISYHPVPAQACDLRRLPRPHRTGGRVPGCRVGSGVDRRTGVVWDRLARLRAADPDAWAGTDGLPADRAGLLQSGLRRGVEPPVSPHPSSDGSRPDHRGWPGRFRDRGGYGAALVVARDLARSLVRRPRYSACDDPLRGLD